MTIRQSPGSKKKPELAANSGEIFSVPSGVFSGVWGQVCLLFAAWGILCSLNWTNDGLWFQGDAPRHAINGLFWKDLLHEGWQQPDDYARRYYARYPTICPTAYPPVFYLVEAAGFSMFGPSPFVAKWLVLAFALFAGIYTLLWLRRWIEPAAGVVAGLLLLMPGIRDWSHAVMLNVPAMAFGVGALYHSRRGLELPYDGGSSRHLAIGVALATLGILTHPTLCTAVFIGLAWMLALGRWRILTRPNILWLAVACSVVLIPAFFAIYHFAPRQFSQLSPPAGREIGLWSSMKYVGAHCVLPMAGSVVLVSAAVGLLAGLARPRWRRESVVALLWIGVPSFLLSCIWAKDVRYLLIACPALVCLIAIAALSASRWLSHWGWPRLARLAFASLLGGLALASTISAHRAPPPSISGFVEVVRYMEQVAPSEPVFYEGLLDGVYTFHLRADDSKFQRQVVLVRKWIVDGARKPMTSQAIGDKILSSGCRWLVMEIPRPIHETLLLAKLRDVIRREEFELVRTFPMPKRVLQRVEVYRIRSPSSKRLVSPPVFDLPQEVFGGTVDPIRR